MIDGLRLRRNRSRRNTEHRMRAILILAVVATACGSRGTAPRVGDPQNPAAATHSDDCERACSRYTVCTPGWPQPNADECVADCRGGLAKQQPLAPTRYADCLWKLSCTDIHRSLSMNEGPAGDCYTRATWQVDPRVPAH